MTTLASAPAAPAVPSTADPIEYARRALRVAEVRALNSERLAMRCERRARVATGKAPMFLVEANRLRAAARR